MANVMPLISLEICLSYAVWCSILRTVVIFVVDFLNTQLKLNHPKIFLQVCLFRVNITARPGAWNFLLSQPCSFLNVYFPFPCPDTVSTIPRSMHLFQWILPACPIILVDRLNSGFLPTSDNAASYSTYLRRFLPR